MTTASLQIWGVANGLINFDKEFHWVGSNLVKAFLTPVKIIPCSLESFVCSQKVIRNLSLHIFSHRQGYQGGECIRGRSCRARLSPNTTGHGSCSIYRDFHHPDPSNVPACFHPLLYFMFPCPLFHISSTAIAVPATIIFHSIWWTLSSRASRFSSRPSINGISSTMIGSPMSSSDITLWIITPVLSILPSTQSLCARCNAFYSTRWYK